MIRSFYLVLVNFLLLSSAVVTNVANAEPYLAIKTGNKCSACHVNPAGGGKRNLTGAAYGQTAASARLPVSIWTANPDSRLSFGADLRGNISAINIPNQVDQLAFELEEALIYAETELIKNQLSLYLDQRVAPGGSFNREAFGLYKFKHGDTSFYTKFGRFFLPYGFRIEDDTAFIRQATGFNFDNPDTGIELGIDYKKQTANIAISNGTAGTAEIDKGKQLSLRTSYVDSSWRLGGSFSFNDAESANRISSGLFAGLRTGLIQWLGEFAFVRDDLESEEDRDQFALFTEANVGYRQGHNIKLTYEHLDSDRDIDENEQNRFSAVYEYFPIQFVQVIGGLRISEGIPQIDAQNTNEAFVQLHLYY